MFNQKYKPFKNKIIMKKIDAIINNGKKFTEKLFKIKQRSIYRAIESSKDNLEKQKEEAVLEYENTLVKLCETSEYEEHKAIINMLLKCKETILNADKTIEVLDQIKADLESEIDDDIMLDQKEEKDK